MTETVNRYLKARSLVEAVALTAVERGGDLCELIDKMQGCVSEDTMILAKQIMNDAFFNPYTEAFMTLPAVADRFIVLMRSTRIDVEAMGRRTVMVRADWKDDAVQRSVQASLSLLRNEAESVRVYPDKFSFILVNKQVRAYICTATGKQRLLCARCFAERDDMGAASTFVPRDGVHGTCISCEAVL